MDIFDAIATRRSVRKYTDRPVTDEDIRTVLEAAFFPNTRMEHMT